MDIKPIEPRPVNQMPGVEVPEPGPEVPTYPAKQIPQAEQSQAKRPTGQPVEQKEFRGTLVRATGDKIFLLKEGKRHWVSTPQALQNLGFKFGDEVRVDDATLMSLAEGEVIK
jgi:hypothetical protein